MVDSSMAHSAMATAKIGDSEIAAWGTGTDMISDHGWTFLSIPAEIRVRVYNHLFTTQQITVSIRTFKEPQWQRLIYSFRLFGPKEDRPYILLACKQTYTEAWIPMLRGMVLHYGIPGLETSSNEAGSELKSASESEWAKHITHGSNIAISVGDLPKVERVYDNIRISYLLWFRHQLARLVPNLKNLTTERGARGDIDSHAILANAKTGIIRKTSLTGPGTRTPAGFDLIITGITTEEIHAIALSCVAKLRRQDQIDRRQMRWDHPASNASPHSTSLAQGKSDRHLQEHGNSTYSGPNKSSKENPIDSEFVAIQSFASPYTTLAQRNQHPYLLAMSRDFRGFSVSMHFTVDIFVSHAVQHSSIPVSIPDPTSDMVNVTWVEDKARVMKYHTCLVDISDPEFEHFHWDGYTTTTLVRRLNVTYDWDTGDLVELRINRI